jgi:hypothetical protein
VVVGMRLTCKRVLRRAPLTRIGACVIELHVEDAQ